MSSRTLTKQEMWEQLQQSVSKNQTLRLRVGQLEKENKRLNEAGTGFMLKFEQLKKDKARLDWLQEQREPVPDNNGETLLAYGWGVYGQTTEVREAIDAAMGQQGNMKHTEFLDYEDLPPK